MSEIDKDLSHDYEAHIYRLVTLYEEDITGTYHKHTPFTGYWIPLGQTVMVLEYRTGEVNIII